MRFPPDDIESAESLAAGLARRVDGVSASWGELIAIAQRTVGASQEYDRKDPKIAAVFHSEDAWALTAAARILDTAARLLTREEAGSRRRLAAAAMVAFAAGGNFPSARAASDLLLLAKEELSETEALLLALCVPAEMGMVLGEKIRGGPARQLLEQVNAFLTDGSDNADDVMQDLFIQTAAETREPFAGAMLRSCRLVLSQISMLGTARVLGQFGDILPAELVQQLVDSGVKVLLPSQYRAVEEGHLLAAQANMLVVYPTNTGKTLLGELCAAAGLGCNPGVSIYVAPYVAIGRQVLAALSRHLPKMYRVYPMFGAYSSEQREYGVDEQCVIVATPERLDGFLRGSPDVLTRVRTIVVDEGHLVQNSVRGARLEGILTRIRLLQEQGFDLRLVVLSAVIDNTEPLRQWRGLREEQVLQTSWRPTVGRIARWRQDGILEWRSSTDVRRLGSARDHRSLGHLTLPLPETGLYSTEDYGEVKWLLPKADANTAFIADYAHRYFNGPVLVVSATKAATRRIARTLADRFPELAPLPKIIGKAVTRIEAAYRQHQGLVPLLRKGIAYHNSTVPHEIRALIEDSTKTGEMRIVSATTTLAEGVDLPFRTTILADWLVWTRAGLRPMDPLLFRNIIGRSGRAGVFTEGDTILVDNPLGKTRFTAEGNRHRVQEEVMSRPAFLSSALVDSRGDPEEHEAVEAVMAGQFLAAVAENPDEENLATKFGSSLFAAKLDAPTRYVAMTGRFAAELLDDDEGAFATAASPLRLTALGKAANLSGLSPATCRQILRFLRTVDVSAPFHDMAASLLVEAACSPEQQNSSLRKIAMGTRARSCIKRVDLSDVVRQWVEGNDLEDLFLSLPYVQRSTRKPRAESWVAGKTESPSWEEEYDKFLQFMLEVVGMFLPWMLRACGSFAGHCGRAECAGYEWFDWADRLEQSRETLGHEEEGSA